MVFAIFKITYTQTLIAAIVKINLSIVRKNKILHSYKYSTIIIVVILIITNNILRKNKKD
jgi:hypothetical protein